MGCLTFALHDSLIYFRSVTFAIVSSLLILSGCTTGPKQMNIASSLPPLKYELKYSSEPPRSVSIPVKVIALRAEDSLAVTVTFIAARQFPVDFLTAAELQTSMITVFPADKFVTPVARLTKGTKMGSIEDASQFIARSTDQDQNPNAAVLLHRFTGVLPPEITASFQLVESSPVGSQPPEGIEIQICQRSIALEDLEAKPLNVPSLEIALIASGRLKPETKLIDESSEVESDSETDEDLDLHGEVLRVTETIFLKPRPFEKRDQFTIILPSPFDTVENIMFAIVVDVKPSPAEGSSGSAIHAFSFNECMMQLSHMDSPGRSAGAAESGAEWAGYENALRALRSPLNQRQALLYLAEQTHASLVEDIALSGTDMIIRRLSQAITNNYLSGLITSSTSLGWSLERTTYSLLITLLSSDQELPELEAILIRHTGQVGRHVSTLEELTANANDIDEFQSLLVRENFIYLEDISPAARTRAFEWLKARNQAPDGYDPLASLKERRAVLKSIEKSFDLE